VILNPQTQVMTSIGNG